MARNHKHAYMIKYSSLVLGLQSVSRDVAYNRDLKIVFYGKRLTSDTLLAIKTKLLTVKYITYRICSKYRKLRIETPCLTTGTWRLILNDFVLK